MLTEFSQSFSQYARKFQDSTSNFATIYSLFSNRYNDRHTNITIDAII